ncbi:hypothetical protein EGJ15_02730 [Pseudomonas sp. p99-361]|nr:hypothetical protein EGJ15_02730 [Pseudomonas sp. p99-361]
MSIKQTVSLGLMPGGLILKRFVAIAFGPQHDQRRLRPCIQCLDAGQNLVSRFDRSARRSSRNGLQRDFPIPAGEAR